MTIMGDKLAEYRGAVLDEVDRYVANRTGAQRQEVRAQVEAVADDVVAAPLSLALVDALGTGPDRRRAIALATAFVELAVLSLRRLCGGADGQGGAHDQPLTLNAADGLYALGHLALVDLAGSVEGVSGETLAQLDARAADVWRAAMEGGPFGDWAVVASRLGRLAGEAAALGAARAEVAGALGELGESLAQTWAGRASSWDMSRVVNGAPFTEDERAKLLALSS